MRKPKPKRGRPKAEDPCLVTIGVRLPPHVADDVRRAAKLQMVPVSVWARKALFLASRAES